MTRQGYITLQEGAYRVGDTRVSLDSVVYAFREGQTPETIVQWFPSLNLEQVYGAITYYLAHRSQVDAYLHAGELEADRLREASRSADPAFYQRLASARQRQE